MKQKFLGVILFVLVICSVPARAQVPSSINLQNLSTVKVDDLSDEQIKEFWEQALNKGMTIEQLSQVAMQRNMNPEELAKLKKRIEILNIQGGKSKSVQSAVQDGSRNKSPDIVKPTALPFDQSKIFGAELFSNKNLMFEPNLKIATPSDYQLGPDDELIIDISGYSEAAYTLKVSPDGQIRIPQIGPVNVSGQTIEQARRKIIQRLSGNYAGINSGETFVTVSLGNIRSIKITLLGEVSLPGTYTLPSLATVFNALYASGGPNKNGSFRNIQVIRGGKVVAKVDVYEFLLKGSTKGNVRLQDQDVIKVNPYVARVELKGEVKREGYYEVANKETLKDVIGFAGGFTDEAYKDRIKVFRNTSKEKSVADIPQDIFGMFVPQTGDIYTIDKILNRFENRVQIKGAVFRPGYFALDQGMKLSDLIAKADGLKEDAFLTRGILYRLKEDNTQEVVSFDLTELKAGKDVVLKREDEIFILSLLDLHEEYSVSIAGEVINPGKFKFASNMKVEDLILAAGGLKESADRTKIEIARQMKTIDITKVDATVSNIITYEVDSTLRTKDGKEIVLKPFDVVSIYKLPGYQNLRNITLEGEVVHPGQYTLTRNNERISEIIKRAGGLTASGYADGAVLVRTRKMSSVDQFIKKKKMASVIKQSSDTSIAMDINENDIGDITSIVGINLAEILENPGSNFDLVMEEGDVIRIPRANQTVKVSGEVLYPLRVQYEKGKSFNYYVKNAGGYTEKGLKRKGYTVYANGSAYSTHKVFLVFNKHPKIKPGAEIIIPAKEEKRKLTPLEIASISSTIATIVLLIYTITK